MTQPELIHINWQLFKADGDWHDIGHGIEVMAYPYMAVGAIYMRAKEPLPEGSGQGPHLAATGCVDQQQEPSQSISSQADHA